MKFSKYAATAAVLALGLTGCAGGSSGDDSAEKSYNWDFTITVSDTSSWQLGADKFAEVLDKESDGRIKVNVFANEQLSGGDPAAGVEQLINGSKAFSYNSTIIYSGIDPRYGAINAPFLYADYDEADAAIENGALDAYKELANETGVELLGFGESGFRQVTNNKHAISKPSDLSGMKMRVPGSSLFLDIYKTLGADPVTMDFSEVFTSLQNGTIDGQENPVNVVHSFKLSETQTNMTMTRHSYAPAIFVMGLPVWQKLPEDVQGIIKEAAQEAAVYERALNAEEQEAQMQALRDAGMTINDNADLAAFAEAVTPVYEKYGARFGDYLPRIQEQIRAGAAQ